MTLTHRELTEKRTRKALKRRRTAKQYAPPAPPVSPPVISPELQAIIKRHNTWHRRLWRWIGRLFRRRPDL